MNDKLSNPPIPDTDAEDTSLLNLLFAIAKYKRLIITLPLVAGVLAFAVSFAIAPSYRASVTILPPQQAQSGAAALLAQLGGAASMVAGASGIKNPGDVYIGMLKSRTIADRLVARFNLQKVYDVDTMEETRKKLEGNSSINSSKEGMITVITEDEDKTRVAAMANAYIDELTKLTRVLAVTESSQRRLFFERQLEQAKDNLAASEVLLKKGLELNGVISVDSDSRAIVETVGRLRAQISAKEIQLNSMRSFVTVNNQEFKRTEQELSSLRQELGRLENGQQPAGIAAIQKTPGGLENIKTLREVKYNQMLYELLAKQYEAARLDEARETSVIQTLDPAVVPEKPFAPKRVRLAVIAALLAFFAALVIAYMRDATARLMAQPGFSRKWPALRAQLGFRK